MRFKYVGNKKDTACAVIKNGDSIAIRSGAPVFLKLGGTDDGLAVVSSNNLAAAKGQFFFGVAIGEIAAGAFGEAQVYGYCEFARIGTATRSASTAVWASYPAGVVGDMMGTLTGTGGVAASISADQCFTDIAAGSAISISGLWPAVLGSAYASTTTQASSITAGVVGGASGTLSTFLGKIFVRSM